MKITLSNLLKTCVFLLIILWVYTAMSKVIKYEIFHQQMSKQAIPEPFKKPLTVILPAIEIIAAVLLLYERTRLFGLWLSAILMGLFTGYTLYVILGLSDRHPCSCGGILGQMGWIPHFYFNLFYLLLTMIAIYIQKRTEKGGSLARQF